MAPKESNMGKNKFRTVRRKGRRFQGNQHTNASRNADSNGNKQTSAPTDTYGCEFEPRARTSVLR